MAQRLARESLAAAAMTEGEGLARPVERIFDLGRTATSELAQLVKNAATMARERKDAK